MIPDTFVRPRLVLLTRLLPDGEEGAAALGRALAGGDVATVILQPAGRDAGAFQDFAERLVPMVQDAGAAAIVADDTRCAGRVKADGVHVTGGDREALQDAMARFSPRVIVGGSGFATRHDALEAGELMPDYLLFGRLERDEDPAPSPRDLALAEWWADIVEIPCIVLGGSDPAALREAATTGAEFVALSAAVFGQTGAEGSRVREANDVLDALAREAEAA